ncbi:MAG: hypothetical protein EPN97_11545 [Alphaproteobacteria bacterium]|nr:MAG: hypothetical protein EPN97_11545 [Alphaproteobacteria bacterium]
MERPTQVKSAENGRGYADGRKPVDDLYGAFMSLVEDGWISEAATVSSRERDGRVMMLPIPSLRTKKTGRAIWIISGIHGEEPAGPNAIASSIGIIRDLGRDTPVVLLPLCNPLGYVSSWRYLDRPDWQEDAPCASVGDSEHVLPDLLTPAKPRTPAASSPEAAALVAHVLRLAGTYPPAISIDFHEDNLLDEGYVYSQGRHGAHDEIAQRAVEALRSSGIPIRMTGKTRFGENISGGVVGPQNDGSIDELLSMENIIVGGKTVPGPQAESVLVIETPTSAMPLEVRQRGHLAVLSCLRDIAPKRPIPGL